MSDLLRQQTLALLGRQCIAQALSSGGSCNSAVAEMMSRPETSARFRGVAVEALADRCHSDAVALRQRAENASEAASMAGMIAAGTHAMAEIVNGMLTLAQAVRNNEMPAAAAAASFAALASRLAGMIGSTRYNGIPLLDMSGCAGDERLTVSGETAILDMRAGNAAATFILKDFSNLKSLRAEALADPAALDSLMDTLSANLDALNTASSAYASIAGSSSGEANFLTQQADALSRASGRGESGLSGERTPELEHGRRIR